jgi:hypothetical protein
MPDTKNSDSTRTLTTESSSSGKADSSSPSEETKAQLRRFISEFSSESDRACVILGAARLDVLLKRLLHGFLRPSTSSNDELLDGDSPLGTFSSRIHASHRLGLIDSELVRALNLIRRIRNEFAHEASTVSLSNPSHRDRIRQLVQPVHDTTIFRTFSRMKELGSTEGSARDFRTALAFICARLEGAAERVVQVSHEQQTTLYLKRWKSTDNDAADA